MSRFVLILAIVFSVVWAWVHTNHLHGHGSDEWLRGNIEDELQAKEYLQGNTPITTSVVDHWVTLEGKVPDTGTKRDLGLAALAVPGTRGVLNDVQVLNEPALARLRDVLAEPPNEIPVNYLVKEHGTVVLSGPVEDPDLQDRIVAAYEAIAGVQEVEATWTDDLSRIVEERLREIMRLHNIYFDFNKWSIRPESTDALDKISEVLGEYPRLRVRIEGHTDAIGSDGYNLDLSNKRSRSVLDALVARGIQESRLESIGYGETRPIAPNTSPEARAENRRIEFRVVD